MAPVVSVLTPVYNGEEFLDECIQSVRDQTWTDWEHVIVDNCSTDRSAEIASQYASIDTRIRLVRCTEFVNVHASLSRTVEFMDPRARYCKFICADDVIYPRCLERMVAVAEKHPTVGIVSAYRMYGDSVNADRVLPETEEFRAGRDVLRRALIEGVHGTGSPTTVLYTAEAVRRRKPFFDEAMFHSDTDAALRTLLHADFGFVHEVLSLSRLHADTVTSSFADRINTYLSLFTHSLVRYGPAVLGREECQRALHLQLRRYWWFLFKARLQPSRCRDETFQAFHGAQVSRMLAELVPGDATSLLLLKSMRMLLPGRDAQFENP